ncbi:hypothetical protein H2204_000024 [Knufia peltigerae]|uniref:DNA2/NAM7 helicase helicase domain-containing protein n=1 Tax=Knufia peltigerae TaxID=1002370 RepID=A0AA38YG47_9EURO|nr:hypothetical protein H2204_000024 [Knufia peltigerae]
MEEGNKINLKAELTAARGHVLIRAIAVVTTPSLPVQAKISEILDDKVDMIIVDEASRICEIDTVALVGCYPNAPGKALCGDPNQLAPIVLDQDSRARQTAVPLQACLTANGTPAVMLTI